MACGPCHPFVQYGVCPVGGAEVVGEKAALWKKYGASPFSPSFTLFLWIRVEEGTGSPPRMVEFFFWKVKEGCPIGLSVGQRQHLSAGEWDETER